MTALALSASSLPLGGAFSIEPTVRDWYLQLVSRGDSVDATGAPPTEIVEISAHLLELAFVSALIHEALAERNCRSLRDVDDAMASEIASHVNEMWDVDVVAVMERALPYLPVHLVAEMPSNVAISLEAAVAATSSLIELCPIGRLEEIGAEFARERFAHRCRVAFDGIKAFVLRHGSKEREQIAILGAAYVRGALSINEVAGLMSLHRVDAIALLEERGYSRGIEQIRLSDEERIGLLEDLRRDRTVRRSEPVSSTESIARDVIASERIEGIDARRWIPREGS